LNTGADIGQILTKLELGGHMKINVEPDNTGFISKDNTEDLFSSVTYKWTLGQPCNPNDPNCGKKTFNTGVFQTDLIIGNFDLWRDAFKSEVKIGEHGLTFKWGALVNYIIKKQLLPLITKNMGNPNGPVIDSYEKLLKSLMGGKECLIKDTCCNDFATGISGKQGTVDKTFLETTCGLIVTLGSSYLDATLDGLDSDSGKGKNFILATDKCAIFDVITINTLTLSE
jgi:hypothetical protein